MNLKSVLQEGISCLVVLSWSKPHGWKAKDRRIELVVILLHDYGVKSPLKFFCLYLQTWATLSFDQRNFYFLFICLVVGWLGICLFACLQWTEPIRMMMIRHEYPALSRTRGSTPPSTKTQGTMLERRRKKAKTRG